MKKFMLLLMAVGTFAFTSCSNDDDGGDKKSCEQLAEDYADAIEAYTNDDSAENCEDLNDAAEAYMNSDCQGAENVTTFPCE